MLSAECWVLSASLGKENSDPFRSNADCPSSVESTTGAVTTGVASLFPRLSVRGAPLATPWLRFQSPLIEPDMRISRIRLSDKTSCFRPRKVAGAEVDGKSAECAFPSSIDHDNSPQLPAPPVSDRRVPRTTFEFSLRFHMVCISQPLETPEFRRVAPISTPSSLPASALNQGSFPPSALPDFVSNTSLSATPPRPNRPSRAFG